MAKLITFHKILAGCERGSREAWRDFLSDYTPIVHQLINVYLPLSQEARAEFWRGALRDLTSNNCEGLRAFEHQAEREFLFGLRAFLLERCSAKLDLSQDTTAAPRPTPETVTALLKGLPLIHQEILFLKMAGYSNASLENILRITPAVAQLGLERLRADYTAFLERAEDRCLWPAAWAEVTGSARAAKKEDCEPLRQFLRIQDGHISWYDKDPVEEHLSGCLHCLERWTALREVTHWRREAKPYPPAEVDGLLSGLPFQAERKPRKSFLQRMFG